VPALPHGRDWWPLAYLAVVGSIGAFTTFTWLIRRWPVTRMSFSAVIIPLVALMLGIVVLHERRA
jgi:drug/metabolite transporter (DMT)-like permease